MNYNELHTLVNSRAEAAGNKNEYYASEEYRILYPFLKHLYKEEGHEARRNATIAAKRKLTKAIKAGMVDTGFPVGLFM